MHCCWRCGVLSIFSCSLGRRVGSALGRMARSRVGAGAALAANPGPVLRAGGQVKLSLRGLPAGAAGAAALRDAALPELVSAPGVEAGKLEGAELRHIAAATGRFLSGVRHSTGNY